MDMNAAIEDRIDGYIDEYCADHHRERIWQRPLARCADALHSSFPLLRRVAVPDHFLPGDFMENPRTVVSYFLPFVETMAEGNISGDIASPSWADGYLVTNAMAVEIAARLVEWVAGMGYRAVEPHNIGFAADMLMSRWSQRHVAWIAGHGSFGLNNMLIGEKGCCGRYFSIITDLPVNHDRPVDTEYCLYRRNGSCKVCVNRCFSGALTKNGYDRHKCYLICLKNKSLYKGADVCGKCVVGLPCSFRRP